MTRREIEVVLSDILGALDGIEAAVADKTIDDFRSDWILRHAIERAIEIISEAARHLPEELLAEAPEISWSRVRGIGNVLRHEYHRTAAPIVWAVVTDHLPALREAIGRMRTAVQTQRKPPRE